MVHRPNLAAPRRAAALSPAAGLLLLAGELELLLHRPLHMLLPRLLRICRCVVPAAAVRSVCRRVSAPRAGRLF
jgi:hypothetical protein